MKAAGPRVSTTFNDEVSEGGRIPSLAYIGGKGVFAIFFCKYLKPVAQNYPGVCAGCRFYIKMAQKK